MFCASVFFKFQFRFQRNQFSCGSYVAPRMIRRIFFCQDYPANNQNCLDWKNDPIPERQTISYRHFFSKYSNLECNRQFEIDSLWRYKKKKEKVDFCEIVNQLLRIKIPNNECCSPLSNSKNWHEIWEFQW